MENLSAQLEALLFVRTKPTAIRDLATWCDVTPDEIRVTLAALSAARNTAEHGIHLLLTPDEAQLVTAPATAALVARLADVDADSELTRPSLETLTIIAYRGPVTRPEIEAIRGVNCALILRNLLMRGLVNEDDDAVKMQSVYALSLDALRFFGVHSVAELPDYATLHVNARIDTLLAALQGDANAV